MKIKIQKRKVLISLGIFYFAFTTFALLYVLFASYTNNLSLSSYNAGRKDSVEELIESVKTENGCTAVPIYSGDKTVNVINMDCLELGDEAGS